MGKLRTLVVSLVVVGLAVFGGGGWSGANQVLAPGTPGPQPRNVEVVAIDEATVTLQDVDAPATALDDLRGDITVGFDHDRGYLRLSGAPVGVQTGPVTVTRTHEVVAGNPPAIGDRGAVEVAAFPHDPYALGLDLQDVQAELDQGAFPGWLFPGGERADQWVVFVHDRDGGRSDALRAVHHVVGDLGMSALVVTHRNDPGAPASPDGHGHLGDSEWHDLEGWLAWLRQHHAPDEVVLYGIGQGGSVVASCLRWCADIADVSGVVLDAPLLSASETLDRQARQRGVPGPLVDPLLSTVGMFVGLRSGPDLDNLEHVVALAELDLPVLLVHGTEDTVVPVGPSRALATRDPDQVTLVEYDGGHARLWNLDRERFDNALTEFLTG